MKEKAQPAVIAYIVRDDGKILCVSRKDTGQRSVPGGKVEPSESLLDALRREVKEEVGIDVLAWTSIYSGLHTSGRRVYSYHVWGWRGEPVACELGTTVEWVDPIALTFGSTFGSIYHAVALSAAGLIRGSQ